MNIDPLVELDYNWTPYRYGYDDPVNFIDSDGLWEFRLNWDNGSGWSVTLNWQEGDNLQSLSDQTGFSIDEIKTFYDEDTLAKLEKGEEIVLDEFAGMLSPINDALNEQLIQGLNCWATAMSFSANGEVNPKWGIKDSYDADLMLNKNFNSKDGPKTGDVIRYAVIDGYPSTDLNGDGKVDTGDK